MREVACHHRKRHPVWRAKRTGAEFCSVSHCAADHGCPEVQFVQEAVEAVTLSLEPARPRLASLDAALAAQCWAAAGFICWMAVFHFKT